MTDQNAKDILLKDPLSDITRKERRMLLGVSMFGITLEKTGFVPTKITALGVEFDKTSQQALLGIVTLITLYFISAFVIYGAADYLAWRRSLRRYQVERNRDGLKGTILESSKDVIERHNEEVLWRVIGGRAISMLVGPVSILRAFFEFLLPILVGVYAIQLLW